MLQTMSMAMIITLTLYALFMSHPVSITITIIFQTMILATMLTTMYFTPWFSYILILVFLGGMLVLFSYITSLTPNFSFKLNNLMLMITPPLMISLVMWMHNNKSQILPMTNPPQPSMNKLFFQDMNITIILALFLLMILLVVVQISSSHKGPLQKKA